MLGSPLMAKEYPADVEAVYKARFAAVLAQTNTAIDVYDPVEAVPGAVPSKLPTAKSSMISATALA